MILDEELPVDDESNVVVAENHKVGIAIQSSVTQVSKVKSKDVDFSLFFALFTSHEAKQEREKRAIDFLRSNRLSGEAFLGVRGGVKGHGVRYDCYDPVNLTFNEFYVQSEELNVLQLAIFFEFEELATFIVSEYTIDVGLGGKSKRLIDPRFFLTCPISDEEFGGNSALFNLLMAQKYGQAALSRALTDKVVQHLSEAQLFLVFRHLRHVCNQEITDSFVQNYRVHLLFAKLPFQKQRELFEEISVIQSEYLRDRVANEWFVPRETYEYS